MNSMGHLNKDTLQYDTLEYLLSQNSKQVSIKIVQCVHGGQRLLQLRLKAIGEHRGRVWANIGVASALFTFRSNIGVASALFTFRALSEGTPILPLNYSEQF